MFCHQTPIRTVSIISLHKWHNDWSTNLRINTYSSTANHQCISCRTNDHIHYILSDLELSLNRSHIQIDHPPYQIALVHNQIRVTFFFFLFSLSFFIFIPNTSYRSSPPSFLMQFLLKQCYSIIISVLSLFKCFHQPSWTETSKHLFKNSIPNYC